MRLKLRPRALTLVAAATLTAGTLAATPLALVVGAAEPPQTPPQAAPAPPPPTAAAASAVFADLLAQYNAPALAEPTRPVANLTLRSGRMTLVLKTGHLAPVLAGSRFAGFFFVGTGTFEYASDDPVEHPVLAFNVRKNTDLKPAAEGSRQVLRGEFERAFWLASGTPPPPLPDGVSEAMLDREFADHRARFSRLHARPPAQLFATARLDGADRPLVRVELARRGDEDLLYQLDAVDARSESLSLLLKVPYLEDRLIAVTLSDLPVGRTRRDPPAPRFILSAVDLAVTAGEKAAVRIEATETFTGLARQTRVLLLDLYNERFGRSELDVRRLTVKRIVDEAGNALPFDHRKDQLAVGLATPLAGGESVKLRFELEGDLLHNPGGDSYWELGVEPWFPQPDLAGQYYTVHATVKVPKPFVPFAPGVTVRRGEEGGFNVIETRIDRPVQFMVVLAGKYEYEEETRDGVTVRVASYGGLRTFGVRRLVNLTHKMVAYYKDFLGPFPFPEFNIVEINSWGWGQAPPGFMFITSEAFNPLGGEINKFFSKGINERLAHEIAHQYWGHAVKMPSSEEQWLTEAFAEISAGLLINDLRGKNEFESLQSTWFSRAKEATEAAPIPLANRLYARSDQVTAWSNRVYLLYSKGPWLLNAVRKDVGERPFLVFLKSCQATLAWKFGTTQTVQMVLEAVSKKSWQEFFDAYYWGTGLPAK